MTALEQAIKLLQQSIDAIRENERRLMAHVEAQAERQGEMAARIEALETEVKRLEAERGDAATQ